MFLKFFTQQNIYFIHHFPCFKGYFTAMCNVYNFYAMFTFNINVHDTSQSFQLNIYKFTLNVSSIFIAHRTLQNVQCSIHKFLIIMNKNILFCFSLSRIFSLIRHNLLNFCGINYYASAH